MDIREKSIKYRPISYKPKTNCLNNKLLYNTPYCSTVRYCIILSGSLRRYCKYYDGIENLYHHSLVKDDGIDPISDYDSIKPLRSMI